MHRFRTHSYPLPSPLTGPLGHRPCDKQAGNALLTAVVMLGVVAAGTGALLGLTVRASEAPRASADRFETKCAGSSVNRMAARAIWDVYERSIPPDGTPSMSGMRGSLLAQGLADQSDNAPVQRTEFLARLALPKNGRNNPVLGDVEILSVLVHRVDLPRSSQLVITTEARTPRGYTGASTNVVKRETDVFALEPARWDGLDFAILANNINCVMCHTTVDDARRIYRGAGIAQGGDYQRARVGSIESLHLRDDPESSIAGTLYLGGPAVDAHGAPITDWSALTFLGGDLDLFGRIKEDGFGQPVLENLDPANPAVPQPYENLYVDYFSLPVPIDGILPSSFPLPFRDDGGFDTTTGEATPFGADNRRVDDNEFAATTMSFNGGISGGAIGYSPSGTRVTSPATAQRLVDGTEANLGPVTRGNVVLTGSDANPIRIEGDVAIDGDLIISGLIQGRGALWVRGNIYVRGDLEYADAVAGTERVFGLSNEGTINALGLTAGGNIVMGDPFRPQWGRPGQVDGTPSEGWNFTLEQTAVFNRDEWIKTQPELAGLPERVQTGTREVRRELFQSVVQTTRAPIIKSRNTGRTRTVPVFERVQTGTREEPIFETITVPSALPPGYGASTTQRVQTGTRTVPVFERVQTGTREEPIFENVTVGFRDVERTVDVPFDPPRFETSEVPEFAMVRPMFANPRYRGPDYIPRYYAFGEGDPVPIMNREGHFEPASGLWIGDEMVFDWDPNRLTLADPNDPSDPTLFPAGRAAAVIKTLEPTGSWMDSDLLRGLIQDALAGRDENEPFSIDATLYSANSIFGIVPNSPAEGTDGRIRIQGSILAADLGLLGPVGTEVLYDPRSQWVLDIRDETRIGLSHVGALPSFAP